MKINNNIKHYGERIFSFPMIIGYITCLLFIFNPISEVLQYQRELIKTGSFLTFFTGHFIHWDFSHLFWDLMIFIIFGEIICSENKKMFLVLVLSSTIIISLTVFYINSDILLYRGLSGIDTVLCSYVGISMICDYRKNRLFPLMGISILLFLFGKYGIECITENAIFAKSDNYIILHSVHLIGTIFGMLCALIKARIKSPFNFL